MSKRGTMSIRELLLKMLEDLADEEFKKFKWLLQDNIVLKGFPVIPKYQLEKADRLDTVDKLKETYNQQSVEVVKKILSSSTINRNDLVKELSSARAETQETDLDTCDLNEHSASAPVFKATNDSLNTSSIHNDVTSYCIRIHEGPPVLYQMKQNKDKFGTLTRITTGKKDPTKTNKTILLVGETGTGKSTLVNALVNYAMGVKWEDDVWFEIVEDENGGQSETLAESQTSDVIVYQIFGFEDKTLPYSLTIIDTPGYGDTRGTEQDVIVRQRLLDLFRSDDGVHEINAVGVVVKATDNRLSDRLSYIFDSVVSLFGKNMEENIIALITHSDGLPPENVLQALQDANMKCAKNEDNEPVHFMFNNRQRTQKTKKNKVALNHAWDLSMDGMSQFTDFLKKTAPQNLKKTVKVLKARIRLTACIQNLQERIELTEQKQKEIQQTQEALRKYEQEMKNDKNFTVEVDEVYKDIEPISGGMWWWLNYNGAVCCENCAENCHYPGCTMAWSPGGCQIMKDGYCTSCTGKCPVSDHVKVEWIYVTKTRKVQKTLQDVKEKYEKDKAGWEMTTSLLESLQKEIENHKSDKDQWLEESFQHVIKLDQIALNVNSLSTRVHLDFLIERMKEKGDKEKVQKLEEMKNQVAEGINAALCYRFGKLAAGGKETV